MCCSLVFSQTLELTESMGSGLALEILCEYRLWWPECLSLKSPRGIGRTSLQTSPSHKLKRGQSGQGALGDNRASASSGLWGGLVLGVQHTIVLKVTVGAFLLFISKVVVGAFL